MIDDTHKTRWSIGIDAAAYELPGRPLDIEACAQRHGWPRERVEAIVASGCRYFHAAPEIGEVELATRAVGRLMDEAALAPSDIDLLIHVHTQQFSVPAAPRSLPAEVAHAHGIRTQWAASIGQLGCVGIAGGMRVADALLNAYGEANAALVVSVDRVYGEHYRLRERSGVQSDGAACVLVTRGSTRNRIGHVAIANHAAWHPGSDAVAGVARQMIAMEWQHTRDIIRAACAGSGTPLERFGRVLPNNTDLRGWHSLARAMGVPRARLFEDNVFKRGHACCSDFAINLADAGLAAVDAGAHVIGVMQSNTGAFGAITLHPLSGETDDAN
ncbi:MAG TPA: 3-oxoacyl-ACP synthase [Trinickia sp.]|nr:3-oxoacyl-ACP synthase [Trinickia sp.]